MFLFSFYRLYAAIGIGAASYFFLWRKWWVWVLTSLIVRIFWALAESWYASISRERDFRKHAYAFKQFAGPYGIRLVNKAENDARTRQSLSEVFTGNRKKLTRTVEQLEAIDTLFSAGMRPEGDEYLLHDLKLKYGRHRLETENK
ncbi:MAG: hypothetical protein ACOC4C_00100 [Fibrobacterota bacterium]